MGGPAVCEVDGCGILAVARCASCGDAVCETHRVGSDTQGTSSRCSVCVAKAYKEVDALRDADARSFLASLDAVSDPMELALRAFLRHRGSGPPFWALSEQERPIAALYRDTVFDSHSSERFAEFASWWATWAPAHGVASTTVTREVDARSMLGRTKRVSRQQQGWVADNIGTDRYDNRMSVTIFEDGWAFLPHDADMRKVLERFAYMALGDQPVRNVP